MTAVAMLHRDQIIERVAQGDMLCKVAKDLGIAPPNISKHLAQDPEYKAAREQGCEARLNDAGLKLRLIVEEGFDAETGKPVGIHKGLGNLARACQAELASVQWFAEREFPHRWGQRSMVTVDARVTVEHSLADDAAVLLDSLREVSYPQVIEGGLPIKEAESALDLDNQ